MRLDTVRMIALLSCITACGGPDPHQQKESTTSDALGCGAMYPGQALHTGEALWACSGLAFLIMQGDGNLVLYTNIPGARNYALWASNTAGTPASFAIMQGDGNFVLYDSQWRYYFATWTQGHAGAFFRLQDDDNLVVYTAPPNVQPLWWSGTNGGGGDGQFLANAKAPAS